MPPSLLLATVAEEIVVLNGGIMKILAALFIDDISMFENHDGLTRLNLSGVQFTIAVSDPFPHACTTFGSPYSQR